jgi:flagellum-specific ATP synthase
MERSIAERGRYPAINVLRSISRTMPGCVPEAALPVVQRARRLLATYGDMEELIRLGAYRPGSDATIDEAIHFQPFLEDFLGQRKEESTSLSDGYDQLARILNDDGHSHNELQRHAS